MPTNMANNTTVIPYDETDNNNNNRETSIKWKGMGEEYLKENEGAVLVTPSSASVFRRHEPYNFSFEREVRPESFERKSPGLVGTDSASDSGSEDVGLSLRRLSLWPSDDSGPHVELDVAEEGTEIRLVSSRVVIPRAQQTSRPNPIMNVSESPACSLFSPFNDAAVGVAQMISGADGLSTPKKSGSESINDKDSPFPQACCCKYIFDSPGIFSVHTSMETSISSLLGTKGFWFDGWQAWSLYFDEFGNQLPVPGAAEQPDQLRTGLQNRAFSMNARAQRIRRLHEDMAPFSSIRSQHTLQQEVYEFKRTLSHGDDRSRATTPISDVSVSESGVSLERLLESVKTCGETTAPDTPQADPQDLCYDSDPGEYNYGSTTDMKKSINSATYENLSAMYAPQPLTNKMEMSSQAKFISEFMNTRMTLIWHPAPDTGSKQSHQCVSAWIELGQQLRKTIIQPKFMWRRTQPVANGRIAISNDDLHGIDLLDIARVLEVSKINRKIHPFARKSCSFSVETLEYSHIFEASSEAERNHVVQAIKLIVARLGSKIILNDNTVFDEFFSNMFFSVPGKEPHLIQK